MTLSIWLIRPLGNNDTKWEPDKAASAALGADSLNALWLDAEGKHGWAVGGAAFLSNVKGVVLRYDGTQWKWDEQASAALGKNTLSALWLDADGKDGWAVGGSRGKSGVVLRYDGTQWKRDEAASAASGSNGLYTLWLDADGKRGWAMGGGYSGDAGWTGVVLHYDGTQWKRDEAASAVIGNNAIHALWLDTEGKQGWAVGGNEKADEGDSGVVLHYDGTQWKRDEAASAASGNVPLYALWLDADGKRGWAGGGGYRSGSGVMLRYDGAQWKRDEAASAVIGSNWLTALWLNPEGKRGWAVGRGFAASLGETGVVLRYDGTQWKRDEAASAAVVRYSPNALWLDEDSEHGWAVGKGVMVLQRPRVWQLSH